ncbi:MAG: glucokinase, partial [Candidatus Binataceae bacterium]
MAVRTKAAVLAGDIGGTKTLLGLYRVEGGAPTLLREKHYATRDFKTLEEVAGDFLSGAWAIDAACFGVPGP